ncbi:lipopolysaccharide export system permease protein [Dysgonomonas hofstadii]|uniref:Lipopolysaccharide export system permease protein n=1 Tax=Dysgonomonas hofstadii TaxID=637886 RepID=A0A840CNK7_9BACT|nr:lipopolysaccharide export system permease protein [Dysgonomonas hofstadii]
MMTFGICLFIFIMQFLWRYIEDLVGKGLDNVVLFELFLYAALQLIPMSLPLSLLLASLMAFGNMGERLELLAVKASGVSLLKAMKPLIMLVACISIGAFFFQNEAMPRINVKFRSLLISIKQKSPELDIPEGSFYSGINNYSLYVKKKNKETGMLKDVMIYDTSSGFDNMSVFVCDSALMRVSEDKKYLVLNLFYGQRFANFQQADITNTSNARRRNDNQFVPYGRENFKEKEIIIPFDANFERMDESNLEGTQIAKNIVQLGQSIDSMSLRLDSINVKDRRTIGQHTYLSYKMSDSYKKEKAARDSINKIEKRDKKITENRIDFDSLLASFSRNDMSQYLSAASVEADNSKFNVIEWNQKKSLQKNIRLHEVEWHRKFTLSFACLIFFFIGAPLGAIIRKGGLGMPVVVSVALFIIYYIIDNVGYKMARDGVWYVWQGMWLSSAVLFPLGVFLTYKAMNDSALFNPEAYNKFFRKIMFIKEPRKLNAEERSILVDRIPPVSQLNIEPERLISLQAMDSDLVRDIAKNYIKHGYGKDMQIAAISVLKEREAELDDLIGSQSYEMANEDYTDFCKSALLTGIGYVISLILLILNIPDFSTIIYAAYGILFIRSATYYMMFYAGIIEKSKLYHLFNIIALFTFFPVAFLFVKKDMEKVKEKIGMNI